MMVATLSTSQLNGNVNDVNEITSFRLEVGNSLTRRVRETETWIDLIQYYNNIEQGSRQRSQHELKKQVEETRRHGGMKLSLSPLSVV